jgi:hypothetical protein
MRAERAQSGIWRPVAKRFSRFTEATFVCEAENRQFAWKLLYKWMSPRCNAVTTA